MVEAPRLQPLKRFLRDAQLDACESLDVFDPRKSFEPHHGTTALHPERAHGQRLFTGSSSRNE
jgi:hypothetical protein